VLLPVLILLLLLYLQVWRGLDIPFETLYEDEEVEAGEDGGYDPIDLLLLDYGVALAWLEKKQNTKHQLGLFPMMARMFLGNNLAKSLRNVKY
jgi:hypothetical protein